MGTDSYGRQIIRYSIRIQLRTGRPAEDRMVEYKAVTSLGELKAAAMAALKMRSNHPDANFDSVEVVNRETDFKIDQERDLLDYLGGMDQVRLSEPVLNNRELAALLLLIAFLAGVSLVRPVRASLRKVARALFAPKLLGILVVMLAYVGLLIWLGLRTGVWNWDLASETVTWFVGSAFVLLLNLGDASRQSGFFWRVVLQTLGITFLVDFFMNDLFVLSLPGELVLQVVVTFVVLLSLVAARDPAHRPVKKLADLLVSLIVLGLTGFILIQIVMQWDQVTTQANLLELLLPAWLTLAFLPFIYVASILVAYGSAFQRIEWALGNTSEGSRKAKLALVTVLRGRRVDASRFAGGWAKEAATAPSFRAARRVAKEFKAWLRNKESEEKEARGFREVRGGGRDRFRCPTAGPPRV
jgi:hypothetical protein